MDRWIERHLGCVWIIGERVGAAEHVATIVRHISCLGVSLLDIRYHSDEICTKKSCSKPGEQLLQPRRTEKGEEGEEGEAGAL